MSKRQIAVTGYGINSAIGIGGDANSLALQAGKSGIISTRETWSPHKFKSMVAGNVSLEGLKEMFDRKQSRFLCEAALLAAGAMQHAIEHAGLTDEEVQAPDTGVIVGTGAGAPVSRTFCSCANASKSVVPQKLALTTCR